MIIMIIDGESREVKAANPMEALRSLSLPPDSFLILQDGAPIPIDKPLGHGAVIRAVRVASGG